MASAPDLAANGSLIVVGIKSDINFPLETRWTSLDLLINSSLLQIFLFSNNHFQGCPPCRAENGNLLWGPEYQHFHWPVKADIPSSVYTPPDMADNTAIDVIQSHEDERDSLASRGPDPGNAQSQSEIPVPADPDEKYKRDVPPDGGYGWVCVICVFWINAHTWGINSVSEIPL